MGKKSKVMECKYCGQSIAKSAKRCPYCGGKNKKPFFKTIWFYILILFAIVGVGGAGGSSDSNINKEAPVTVVDFSVMSEQEIRDWCADNGVVCEIDTDYSDTIPAGNLLSQSDKTGTTIYEGSKITIVYSIGKEPSEEYKNALKKAQTYSEVMYMSKDAIYDQLISEYGEGFDKDAAKYAVNNVKADWNRNALKKAESYSETSYMSKEAIYDQLISEYGEKFTKKQAQYAIDNIEADWNENALKKAKTYRDTMDMSKKAIYKQLISEYGEKFTEKQAQYAIDHLDD